jgi:hypothetical protein
MNSSRIQMEKGSGNQVLNLALKNVSNNNNNLNMPLTSIYT